MACVTKVPRGHLKILLLIDRLLFSIILTGCCRFFLQNCSHSSLWSPCQHNSTQAASFFITWTLKLKLICFKTPIKSRKKLFSQSKEVTLKISTFSNRLTKWSRKRLCKYSGFPTNVSNLRRDEVSQYSENSHKPRKLGREWWFTWIWII